MSNFPSFKQLDSMDCGSTCLRIIAKYYGKDLDALTLRENCYTSKNGVSLLAIKDEAEKIGFKASGVKITWEQFKEYASLPCIVHWNQQHFVVVYKISRKFVCISDPEFGRLKISIQKFLKYWLSSKNKEGYDCGIALLLEPTSEFFDKVFINDRNIKVTHLLRFLSPYKLYYGQLFLGMVAGIIISLIFPFISQGIVDFGIENNNLNFIVVMLFAQLFLVIGQFLNGLIRNWLMLHITCRISISFVSSFLSKLLRLPIAFFDNKRIGDILQRIEDYSRIEDFLTQSLLSMSVSVVTFIIYSLVMGFYDANILAIFLIGSIVYVFWILLFLKKRKALDYLRFQIASKNQSNLVELIAGMQDVKLNNCETIKRQTWEHLQVKAFNVSLKSLSLSQIQNTGGILITQSKDILISFLAAKAVIDGNITLGMMMAVQYIIGQLNGPISQLISFIQSGQDAKISLERLNEIYRKKDEEYNTDVKDTETLQDADIVFNNFTFQYGGPNSEKVLNEITLRIPANKVTAIVGYSGSGKTTLLKSILGFYKPVSGEIYIGDKKMNMYKKSFWRSICGAVMQDGYIFSDSIANNIGICDKYPNMDRVKTAARIANIDQFVESLPLKYNTIIGLAGNGLSSGQKQRLLIARAVYKDARYLIFDEATNSLDANNERIILDKLNGYFSNKTVIVAAHRLSTIKKADKIVVLNHGKIVEEGTHVQLIEKKGEYYQLVKNQLELEK